MITNELSSFRDPSGFLFWRDGILLRQINRCYQADYDHLVQSGLCQELQARSLLVGHHEVDDAPARGDVAWKVIRPERVGFISYPYEWCFSQLKDAALLTLQLQKTAMQFGMTLKDASAYNVQFVGGRPVFIDTLSFERRKSGEPWVAYRQFCQHFLAPLLLMAKVDVRLGLLSRVHIDGVPLDLASRLLPKRSWVAPSTLMHVHLHARAQAKYSDAGRGGNVRQASVSDTGLKGIIDSLESCIAALQWRPDGTEWGDYYSQTNYSDSSFAEKARLVREFYRRSNRLPSLPSTLARIRACSAEWPRRLFRS